MIDYKIRFKPTGENLIVTCKYYEVETSGAVTFYDRLEDKLFTVGPGLWTSIIQVDSNGKEKELTDD